MTSFPPTLSPHAPTVQGLPKSLSWNQHTDLITTTGTINARLFLLMNIHQCPMWTEDGRYTILMPPLVVYSSIFWDFCIDWYIWELEMFITQWRATIMAFSDYGKIRRVGRLSDTDIQSFTTSGTRRHPAPHPHNGREPMIFYAPVANFL